MNNTHTTKKKLWKYTFSVIIPTYNSAESIKKCLSSIRKQKFDQKKIEILLIDGGSSDDTLELAKSFNVKIISNPLKLPEEAKSIGIKYAQGEFLVFQDSDEEIVGLDSYAIRQKIFNSHPTVNNIVPRGLKNPPGYSIFSEYTNVVGDPFSYYLKHQDGSDMYASYKNRLRSIEDNADYALFLSSQSLRPILDAGGHTVRNSIDNNFHNVFVDTLEKTGQFAVLKKSFTNHYSTSHWRGILSKIDFRVKNNLQGSSTAGYANRESKNMIATVQKLMFVLYAATCILPFLEGMLLAIKKSNWVFLLLPFFAFYTLISIIINVIFTSKITSHYGK